MHRFVRATSVGLIARRSCWPVARAARAAPRSSAARRRRARRAGQRPSIAPGASVAPTGGTSATCKQLTFDQVQPLLKAPITQVEVTAFGLSGTGPGVPVRGGRQERERRRAWCGGSDGTTQYDGDVSEFASPAPLPGVGDKAMWDSNDKSAAFAAIKGDEYCSVSVEAEDVPGVGALMDAADNTNQIGDANYLIISTALATVCNRIYGSGNTTIDLSGLAPGPSVSPAF